MRATKAIGSSGVIQSRESMLSEAMADATKCRRCPQNDRAPNHTTPRGCSLPRVKRRMMPVAGGPGRIAFISWSNGERSEFFIVTFYGAFEIALHGACHVEVGVRDQNCP